MKWVGMDKWAAWGFCQPMQSSLLGVSRAGRFWPYVIIPGFCVGVSLWQLHQLWLLCGSTHEPIYSLQGYCRPRNRNKLIHTSSSPIWLTWHISDEQKKNILACWKSWGKIGHYGDQAAGPPRPIKLQSDVNFCSESHSPLHTSNTN